MLLTVSPYLTLVYYTTGMANLKMILHVLAHLSHHLGEPGIKENMHINTYNLTRMNNVSDTSGSFMYTIQLLART